MKNPKTMKSILQHIALLFFSVLIGLLICEIGLRISGFKPGNPFERLINHYDGYLGYRLIPGMHESIRGPDSVYSVDITSLGFKDGIGFRDKGAVKPVYSIFIGDSFVWGYGVELADCISEQFERLSGKSSVNMGMTSWTSPTQYSRIYAKYGTELEPQYAFIEFFVGNDFGDETAFLNWEQSGTKKSYPEWHTVLSQNYSPNELYIQIREFIYKNSSLGRLISDRIHSGLSDRIFSEFKSRKGEHSSNIIHINTGAIDLDLDKSELSFQPDEPSSQDTSLVRKALDAMKNTGTARSIKTIIFIIPTKEMVYQSLIPDSKLRNVVDPRYVSILNILNDSKITYIDLLPVFREAASRGEQLYFRSDGHWNAKGHLLAAKAIRDFLTANNHN